MKNDIALVGFVVGPEEWRDRKRLDNIRLLLSLSKPKVKSEYPQKPKIKIETEMDFSYQIGSDRLYRTKFENILTEFYSKFFLDFVFGRQSFVSTTQTYDLQKFITS